MSENIDRIIKVNIETEMKSAYIDYSMSVIVSRALPDVRDGLKPVHRRVLYGMNDLGLSYNKPHKKSARIVGEVLGKYHPHGDSSVYGAMVRMAQPWSLRYQLVDGQGNFGSVDDDSPAAMRYTESRFKKLSHDLLIDIEKETVDFKLNFDDTLYEPTVLPTRVPNLLINGSSGIAVGMATNMAPHNLKDTIDATIAYINNEEIEIDELINTIKAPDFPTGGIIYGYQGVRDGYLTGRGRVVLRGKHHIEETSSGKPKIIFTEIPYQVNKAAEIARIGQLVKDGKIDGIVYANDESDRNGMRIVVTCKRDAIPNVVLNKLFKYTYFQTSFSVNNIALVNGRPRLLNLKEMIVEFVKHRHEVVYRRTEFELRKAEEKAHILEGIIIALDHLDEVIALIRASKTPNEARIGLMENFELSEIQAKAILEMRLQKLTGLEIDKVRQEYKELMELIAHLRAILADKSIRTQIIKEELLAIRQKYYDERRTEIVMASEEFNPEDFYADEKVVISISKLGYIKRTQLTEYRTQNRGGKGAKGSTTRNEDFIEYLFIASMHNTMLLFSEKGKCFWLKVWEIPEGSKISKGRAIQNLLQIERDDNILAYLNVKNLDDPEFLNNNNIIMCTKKGTIKKTKLEAYSRPRKNGIIAINIKDGDKLLSAKLTNGTNHIMLASRTGKAIRFPEEKVRTMGRSASGVRGMRIDEDNEIVGMICVEDIDTEVLVVSENGYGKRSAVKDYRETNRGGKGVKTINITEKTGNLITIKNVTDEDDLMIMNKSGITIRIEVSTIRVAGRATQGVKLISLKDNDTIASVAKIEGGGNNEEEENAKEIENGELKIENEEEIENENTEEIENEELKNENEEENENKNTKEIENGELKIENDDDDEK